MDRDPNPFSPPGEKGRDWLALRCRLIATSFVVCSKAPGDENCSGEIKTGAQLFSRSRRNASVSTIIPEAAVASIPFKPVIQNTLCLQLLRQLFDAGKGDQAENAKYKSIIFHAGLPLLLLLNLERRDQIIQAFQARRFEIVKFNTS